MSGLRLGGLMSGMDTQDIISQLMDAARKPLIKLENDRELLDLKKSTFVISKIKSPLFRNLS